MPDQPPTPPPPGPTTATAQRGPTIHIADEFGTAKRNLPPVKTLLIAIAAVLAVTAGISFFQRARPQAAGSLDGITAVQIPGQDATLVALTFTLRNTGEKNLWAHDIQGKLVTTAGEQTGDALSAVDFDRYYQAFPALKVNSRPPLSPEDKLKPGQEIQRTVVVSFPVNLDAFNQRKSVSVIIQPYDQPKPVTLTQ